jgi:hypothetical protein
MKGFTKVKEYALDNMLEKAYLTPLNLPFY